jgi:hypothetical protein
MPSPAPARLTLSPRAPPGREVHLRPFGGAEEDLAVDFARPPSPAMVTDVLACCAQVAGADEPAEEVVDALPVATRLECLVALAGMENPELEVPLRCPEEACGEPIAVAFTVDELLGIAAAAPAEDVLAVEAEGARLVVRRPTGADQAAWADAGWAGEADAAHGIARSLVQEGAGAELTPARLAAVDAALEALDPLTALTVAAACPCCGETRVHEVDVAALALARLAAAQRRTIEQVHVLACRYHWSEAEALAVPAQRRGQYLALLERERR